MARLEIRVLAEGTPVKIRGERGSYVVTAAVWSNGREVDHLARTDGGNGPFRSVTRDRVRVVRGKRDR